MITTSNWSNRPTWSTALLDTFEVTTPLEWCIKYCLQVDEHVLHFGTIRQDSFHKDKSQDTPLLQPACKYPRKYSATSELFHLKHIQPVHDHHSLDKIPLQVHMPMPFTQSQRTQLKNRRGVILHPIKLITLNSSIPGPQMLQPPPLHLNAHRLLKNHQGFVSLAHDPLVWFLPSTRIRGHK